MTACQRIIQEANQLQKDIGFISHSDAVARARAENPGLAFAADQESKGCRSEFYNTSEDNAGDARRQKETAATTKERRIRNAEIVRNGWEKVYGRARTKGITDAEALEEVKREDIAFANAFSMPPIEMQGLARGNQSGASDGRTGHFTAPKMPSLPGAAQNSTGGLSTDELTEAVALDLPYDTTVDELNAAKSAGSKDRQKVWDALVKYTARTRNSNTYIATMFCMGRFQKASAGVKVEQAPTHSSQGTSRAGEE